VQRREPDLKQAEERVDAPDVRRKEPSVTPVLDPPQSAKRSTASAAIELDVPAPAVSGEDAAEADEVTLLDAHFWAEGIDYERWAPIVEPSPRSAFADPLDLLDRDQV
jgi:hypothetical protein